MNTLTTKYGKLYAITIAIFFTFSIFFGVSTFYPEPDFDEIIGEQPIYPIKPDNMSKEEVLVFEEKLKEHRVAEDAWWERELKNKKNTKEGHFYSLLLYVYYLCFLHFVTKNFQHLFD